MSFSLISPTFRHGSAIPARYTCDGEDLSPALSWSDVPVGTQSLVLIVDEPDAPNPKAPRTTWVHWVVYNMPPTLTSLTEGAGNNGLPKEASQGFNDWKRKGYGGPCPPVGRYRYFHKLYALDAMLSDLGAATKARVEEAMKGHVIAEAQLVGTYQRAR